MKKMKKFMSIIITMGLLSTNSAFAAENVHMTYKDNKLTLTADTYTSGSLIHAMYDGNNRLTDVDVYNDISFFNEISFTINSNGNDKFFLWNGSNSLKPLCDSLSPELSNIDFSGPGDDITTSLKTPLPKNEALVMYTPANISSTSTGIWKDTTRYKYGSCFTDVKYSAMNDMSELDCILDTFTKDMTKEEVVLQGIKVLPALEKFYDIDVVDGSQGWQRGMSWVYEDNPTEIRLEYHAKDGSKYIELGYFGNYMRCTVYTCWHEVLSRQELVSELNDFDKILNTDLATYKVSIDLLNNMSHELKTDNSGQYTTYNGVFYDLETNSMDGSLTVYAGYALDSDIYYTASMEYEYYLK